MYFTANASTQTIYPYLNGSTPPAQTYTITAPGSTVPIYSTLFITQTSLTTLNGSVSTMYITQTGVEQVTTTSDIYTTLPGMTIYGTTTQFTTGESIQGAV